MADVPRNPNGTLQEGAVLNPKGSRGLAGFAPWEIRIGQLEKKYDTVQKLKALFEIDPVSGKMVMAAEFNQMNPRDAALVMQMINAFTGDDKRQERESFWDRFEGKPLQRSEISGPDRGAIEFSELSSAKQKLLRGVVPDASSTGTDKPDK